MTLNSAKLSESFSYLAVKYKVPYRSVTNKNTNHMALKLLYFTSTFKKKPHNFNKYVY